MFSDNNISLQYVNEETTLRELSLILGRHSCQESCPIYHCLKEKRIVKKILLVIIVGMIVHFHCLKMLFVYH